MAVTANKGLSADATNSATVVVDVAAELDPVLDRSLLERLAIPEYQFESIIAQGGMGMVVAARHRTTGRLCAVKVLPPAESVNDEAVRRFRREADTLARLKHPHIVELVDRGSTDEVMYFAMEFVAGPDGHPLNLKQACARALPSEKQTMRWVMQIVDALGYAHALGIVHRDVKPSNMMLTAAGDVKVADFGVAALVDPICTSMLTRSNAAVGTPLYMAPEQFVGSNAADARADVYSLGMMLYELLTGRLPLGVYEPPSRIAAHLQSGWDKIVARAVQSDRERRFQSMDEFRDALVELRDGRRVSCTTTGYVVRSPSCPKCGATVDVNDSRCRQCEYALFIECPECRTSNTRSQSSCQACRHELDQAWRGRRHRESGERLHEQAAGADDDHARLHLLEASITEFNAALRLNPRDEPAARSLQEAIDAAVDLAWRNAEAAFAGEALGRAQHYARRALAYVPNHAGAVRLERTCEERRTQTLATSADLRQSLRPLEALKALEAGVRAFPDDPSITAAHDELRRLRQEAVAFLRSRGAKLAAEKRFNEIRGLVKKFEAVGFASPDFAEFGKAAKAAIADCRSKVRKADRFFRARLFEKAGRQIAEALEVCVDDPACRKLHAEIERLHRTSAEIAKEMNAALTAKRWFAADRILDGLSAQNRMPTGRQRRAENLDKGPYAEWATAVDAGVERSDRYVQLSAWAILGTFMWVVVAGQCLRLHPLMQPWGPVAAAALFGVTAVFASNLLADVLRLRFRHPDYFNALGLAILLGVCQFVGVRALAFMQAGGVPNLLEFAAPFLLSSAALSATVVGLTRRALDLERQPMGSKPLLASLAAGAVLTVAWVFPNPAVKQLPLALALAAVAALGQTRPSAFGCLSGAALATLVAGLEFLSPSMGVWPARLGQLTVVLAVGGWLGRDPRRLHQASITAILAVMLLMLSWRLPPPDFPVTWMAAAAFVHGTAIAALCLRTWWEPNLHLGDRLAPHLVGAEKSSSVA